MPIGGRGQMMYIPDGNDGPSGPWTNGDTKIAIAACIIFFIICLLTIIIEWQFVKKATTLTLKDYLKDVLSCGTSWGSSYDISIFSVMMMVIFYCVLGLTIIGFSIYGLTTIM